MAGEGSRSSELTRETADELAQEVAAEEAEEETDDQSSGRRKALSFWELSQLLHRGKTPRSQGFAGLLRHS